MVTDKVRLLVVSTIKSIQKLINNNVHPKLHNVINHYDLNKITGGGKKKMAQVSPSRTSGAKPATGTSVAIRVKSVCGLGWWTTRLVFSLQSGENHPLTAACRLTAKDYLVVVRSARALRFVEIYYLPRAYTSLLNRG